MLKRLWQHMRSLWPTWTLLPVLPFLGWALYCFARGERRWEHVVLIFGVPLLAYTGPRSKKAYRVLLPIGIVGLLYDAMRFVKNIGVNERTIHNCDLRALDLSLFGITVGGQKITLNDYFQMHHWTALDVYCAIPYGVFIFVPLGYAIWIWYKDFSAAQRYTWTFLILNVCAFVTYHVYPAAPPWYEHMHGCVVDATAHASAGVPLARVDELLGVHYFAGLYGRSNDVFGAVPSLHCAYPALMILEGWRLHKSPGKAGVLIYFLSTCFAAIYLDHHWAFDVMMGVVYTLVLWPTVRWVLARTSEEARISRTSLLPAPAPIIEPTLATAPISQRSKERARIGNEPSEA